MAVLRFLPAVLSFLVSLVGASCSTGQATSWNPPSTDLKTPSWPWLCHTVYTVKDDQTFADVRNKFEVTGHELLSWNCFLSCDDGNFKPGTQVCVAASLEGQSHKLHLEAPLLKPQTCSSADQGHPAPTSHHAPTDSFKTVTLSRSHIAPSPSSAEPPFERSSESTPRPSLTTLMIATKPNQFHDPTRTGNIALASAEAQGFEGLDLKSSIFPTSVDSLVSLILDLLPTQQPVHEMTSSTPEPSIAWPSPFTEACDAFSDSAEDCRVTKKCDGSRREFPTCVDGKYQCKAIPCSKTSECESHKHCRSDDEDYVCLPEPDLYPKVDGVCQCRPKVIGCLFEGDEKHTFCGERIECTEPNFSRFPNFAQCIPGKGAEPELNNGKCKCLHVDCDYEDGEGDDEPCKEHATCPRGDDAVCIVKYGNVKPGGKKGYCTCKEGNP